MGKGKVSWLAWRNEWLTDTGFGFNLGSCGSQMREMLFIGLFIM